MKAHPRIALGAFERFVLVLTFVAQAAFFPWFPELHSANELSRVYLAESLVEDGSVSIDKAMARHGAIFDLSVREVEGHKRHYSDKAPGLALLATPLIALHDLVSPGTSPEELATRVRLARLIGATLPTLFLLILLMRFLKEELVSPTLPAVLVLTYGLGTVAAPYAGLAFGHQLSALVLFGLFLRVRKTTRTTSASHLIATGLVAGSAILVEYQNALLLLPFVVWFIARTRSPRAIGLAMVGGLVPIALLMAYHQAAFGSPFLTGYSFIASSFAAVHAQGLLGVAWPKTSHAFLSFLSSSKGLFFFSPWLVVGALGLSTLERRGDHRFHLFFVILYALFVSALVYPVGGWTVSQRHLAPMVPFFVLPAGLLIERWLAQKRSVTSWFWPAVFVGLALVSILQCTISAVVWPHYIETLTNPFWQLGWPLFRDGWVPPSALSFMSSWWLLATILATAALTLIGWLVLPLLVRHRVMALIASVCVVTATTVGWVVLATKPGRDQDVSKDRAFIERVYVPDPRSEPNR